MRGFAATVLVLALVAGARAATYENKACLYRLELPAGWSAAEEKGPERVLITCQRDPGVEVRIMADRRTRGLAPEDVEAFRNKVEAALKEKCPGVVQAPAPPNLLGRQGQYAFTFVCNEGTGPQLCLFQLFGPRAGDPAYWYRIQVKVAKGSSETVKEILSPLSSTWVYTVPPRAPAAGAPAPADVEACRFRRCYAVQKEIGLALNLAWVVDGNLPDQLDAGVFASLVKKKHLKATPVDPGQESGPTNFYIHGVSRTLACRVHGSADGSVAGSASRPGFDEWEPHRIANLRLADFAACEGIRKTLANALSAYSVDRGKKPTELTPQLLEELKKGGFISKIPADPGSSGADTFYTLDGAKRIGCRVHGQ